MDQAPESRFGLRFSACGVLDLCHVRNVKKLDQVNCAKLIYIQSTRVDRWKNKFDGKILVEIFGGNVFCGNFCWKIVMEIFWWKIVMENFWW